MPFSQLMLRPMAKKPMSVKQRAYIRTVAEILGWTETEALAECIKAADGAHHATNQSLVARTGRSLLELSSADAYRFTAWLRSQALSSGPSAGEPERYREHLATLEQLDQISPTEEPGPH